MFRSCFDPHSQRLWHSQWSRSRLARECLGVSGRGVGQQWPAAGLGTLSVAVYAWDLLKEVAIIFITSTIGWPQVNNREGTQPHPSTENWIKDLLNRALPIRTRPNFPLSQSPPSRENCIKDLLNTALPIRTRPSFPLSKSLPSGRFHKPLVIIHQKADRMKTTITEN